jgi:putative phosphoesterase
MADIHGNMPALEAVLVDAAGQGVDHIIVAGDLVCGPQPEETRRLLQSLDCTMIRGNGDTYLLRFDNGDAPDYWRTSKAFATIRWHYDQCSDETLDFLRSLPVQRRVDIGDAPAIRVAHGSPRHPAEDLHPQKEPAALEAVLAALAETVLICGHTHLPMKAEGHGRLALNPGAVSAPLNGEVGAQYALLTWSHRGWRVEHRLAAYDLKRIRRIYAESGLLEEGGAFSRAWLDCIESGRDLVNPFLDYARLLADQAGFAGSEFVPDPIWDQAAATFDWPQEG